MLTHDDGAIHLRLGFKKSSKLVLLCYYIIQIINTFYEFKLNNQKKKIKLKSLDKNVLKTAKNDVAGCLRYVGGFGQSRSTPAILKTYVIFYYLCFFVCLKTRIILNYRVKQNKYLRVKVIQAITDMHKCEDNNFD